MITPTNIRTGAIMAFALIIATCNLHAGCNAPNGNSVTVSITSPAANAQLTMSSTGQTLTTLSSSSSGEDDSQLNWSFPDMIFPNGSSGISVSANTPSSWPSGNSWFGSKTITLSYSGGIGSDCSKTRAVKRFYAPLASVNNSTAWFIYYSDGVINKLSDFEGVSETDPDLTEAQGCFSFEIANGVFYQFPMNERLLINRDYFINVAEAGDTVSHEIRHKELVYEVKDANQAIYKDYQDKNLTLQQAQQAWAQVDADGDWVLDANDPNIGNDDNEDIAARYGLLNWLTYIDDINKDWSDGGVNYAY
jgi:hypothetical protein